MAANDQYLAWDRPGKRRDYFFGLGLSGSKTKPPYDRALLSSTLSYLNIGHNSRRKKLPNVDL